MAIWPALMPCDFLPLIGNDMGDWLCVQIGSDGRTQQVMHWYHGGGDWIPWGDSLAQALLFDRLRSRLPGADRDHAIAAVETLTDNMSDSDPMFHWSMEQLDIEPNAWIRTEEPQQLAKHLLRSGHCNTALRCQLIIDALQNPMLDQGDLCGAMDANDIQRGLFDHQLISRSILDDIAANKTTSTEHLLSQQNWDAVAMHAEAATKQSPQLAWGWDLLGYSRERAGDLEQAIQCYRYGMACSIFTDQAVRVRTHGFTGDGQKFSAARLMHLNFQVDQQNTLEYDLTEYSSPEYFETLADPEADSRRDRIRAYFSERASKAVPEKAAQLWKRAGWDLGAEPMVAFAELLEAVAHSNRMAGHLALAELAMTHRECFRQRYSM